MHFFLKHIRYFLPTHTTSVDTFSEKFDQEDVTHLIFFLGTHWFQKRNFWKNSLSAFWGHWGQEVIFEVAEAKFWIPSTFYKFSFRIFCVLCFEVVWPQRPRRPQKGLRNFFKNNIFEISAFQGKRWGVSQLPGQNFN